jgi:S1-C subfamily serine protease
MTLTRRLRRPAATIAAAALCLPLTVAAVAPAAASTVLVDRPWPPAAPYGYGGSGYGYGYGGDWSSSTSTTSIDASVATDEQSSGLVTISSEIDFGTGEAAGSGIVISSDGIVVTNHHVVEGATDIEVTVVSTDTTYQAEVLGYDATKDVAVLQLENASDLATVSTDTSGVEVGDDVTAVGDAGGDGGSLTAAEGTVTDAHEPITVSDEQTGEESRLRNLIEVDADVIAGDSGGALLDSGGDVVGMNVAASQGAPDITGYAIPIGRVLGVVDQVLASDDSGSVEIGYDAFLGVSMGSAGLTLVGVVDGSAAADAGLAAGDTVTALGDTPVSTRAQLRLAVASYEPGDTTTVTWTDASGQSQSASVTLGRAPVS